MTDTSTPRRSRLKRRASDREFEVTDNDVFGFFEPLSRYGRLPTNHLIKFDRRYIHFRRNRLTTLFQETADYHARDQLLYRSDEQWRFGGMNGQAQYKLGPGAHEWLERYGILDDKIAHWMPATKIGPHDDDHDLYLNLAISSLELAVETVNPLRFLTHFDILKKAPLATQHADEPLAIPIGTVRDGQNTLEKVVLKPDALFGFEYADGYRFFTVEFDRGTEPIHATDLRRSSWRRKALIYHKGYGKILLHLGLPSSSLYVLSIIPEKPHASAQDRVKNIMKKAILETIGPSPIFCFQTYAPVKNFTTIKPPTADLLVNPWRRAGFPDLNISQP